MTESELAQELADVREENAELRQELRSVLWQACGEVDPTPGSLAMHYDSNALSAYADGLRLLARLGLVRITKEAGRRVLAVDAKEIE